MKNPKNGTEDRILLVHGTDGKAKFIEDHGYEPSDGVRLQTYEPRPPNAAHDLGDRTRYAADLADLSEQHGTSRIVEWWISTDLPSDWGERMEAKLDEVVPGRKYITLRERAKKEGFYETGPQDYMHSTTIHAHPEDRGTIRRLKPAIRGFPMMDANVSVIPDLPYSGLERDLVLETKVRPPDGSPQWRKEWWTSLAVLCDLNWNLL